MNIEHTGDYRIFLSEPVNDNWLMTEATLALSETKPDQDIIEFIYLDKQKLELEHNIKYNMDLIHWLVPAFCGYKGTALYLGKPFLFTRHIDDLFKFSDPLFAIQHLGPDLILWNCGHSYNRVLAPGLLKNHDKTYFENFGWLSPVCIKTLPEDCILNLKREKALQELVEQAQELDMGY